MKKISMIVVAVLLVMALAVSATAKVELKNGKSGWGAAVIDGEFDECYKNGFVGTIAPSELLSGKDDGTFTGATWYFVNDDTQLYIYFDVKDSDVVDTHGAHPEDPSWVIDGFQVYIPNFWAHDPSQKIGTEGIYCTLDLTPFEAGLGPGVNGTTNIWNRNNTDQFKSAYKITDYGYAIEITIPLNFEGDTFDFGLALFNYTTGTDTDGTYRGHGATFGSQQIRDDIGGEAYGNAPIQDVLGMGTRWTIAIANEGDVGEPGLIAEETEAPAEETKITAEETTAPAEETEAPSDDPSPVTADIAVIAAGVALAAAAVVIFKKH